MTTNYNSKLEKIFTEFFVFNKNIPTDSSNPWQPPTDVYETPDEIVVKMSISGTKSDDIQVAFSDEILTISGYRNDTSPYEKTCFYQVEIRYGYFERSFFIPKPINKKDGFLVVVLPKAEQQPTKAFSIKINIQQ
ncbi:MAG: hsp 1 [Candidatus Brocadiaceae bacterium]|nr:hsp 1 [Candidatus Brocadiaceae bacterium]